MIIFDRILKVIIIIMDYHKMQNLCSSSHKYGYVFRNGCIYMGNMIIYIYGNTPPPIDMI